MGDKERSDERLEEIRRRAREIGSEEGRTRSLDRGPAVSAWRPVGRSGPREGGGYGPYTYGSGVMGYPASASYPFYMGHHLGAPGMGPHRGSTEAPGYAQRGFAERGEIRHAWTPRADVFEQDGNMIVRLELPGLDRKDVEVQVEEDRLIVEGERLNDRPEGEGAFAGELPYGPFCREIPLPYPVDPSDVKARFRNGLLEVVVPQPRREDRRKLIKVET